MTSLTELWGGEDGEQLRGFLQEIARTTSGVVGPVELRMERAASVIEAVGSNLTDDPAVRGLALNFRDISERKVLEQKLRQLAFHDPLTLLANRNLFRDRVEHALARAQRGETCAAVMFLDVDNFKNINDTMGHDAGDRLLQAVAQRLHRLKALGVKLAIDDLGTGYSSLSYLHRFPIDILKIDRSFVNGLTSPDDGPDLARAVITLGETLGLETVAEGIELEPQVAALLALGCVAGQGFLFAPARSLELLSKSAFVARRNTLWDAQAIREQLSSPGRLQAPGCELRG